MTLVSNNHKLMNAYSIRIKSYSSYMSMMVYSSEIKTTL
ncbi:hypothetical protein ACHAW6_000083 [Cyclotella cf. meneghiniana]